MKLIREEKILTSLINFIKIYTRDVSSDLTETGQTYLQPIHYYWLYRLKSLWELYFLSIDSR